MESISDGCDSDGTPPEEDRPSVYLDELSPMVRTMVENEMVENDAARRARNLVTDLIDLITDHPFLWRWGNGAGGWVHHLIDDTAIEFGLMEPPRPRELTDAERERRRVDGRTKRRIMERDEYRCVKCASHRDLEVDHVVPIASGGTSDDENLQTLCKPCHRDKTRDEREAARTGS